MNKRGESFIILPTFLKAAMEKPTHQLLFLTRILQNFESDTFFPEIDFKQFKLLQG